MGTPWAAARTEHKLQVRRRIADAARELAIERGLAATTMGAVAERAQVSRATVYNYFPDVEAALAWAVEEEVRRFARHVGQELAGGPGQRLRGYVTAQVGYFTHPDRRAAALHFKLAGLSPLIRERMREHTTQLEAMLTAILTDGVECGDFRADLDPHRCAELILHLLTGIREQVLRGDVPVGALVDELLAFIEHGLRGQG